MKREANLVNCFYNHSAATNSAKLRGELERHRNCFVQTLDLKLFDIRITQRDVDWADRNFYDLDSLIVYFVLLELIVIKKFDFELIVAWNISYNKFQLGVLNHRNLKGVRRQLLVIIISCHDVKCVERFDLFVEVGKQKLSDLGTIVKLHRLNLVALGQSFLRYW